MSWIWYDFLCCQRADIKVFSYLSAIAFNVLPVVMFVLSEKTSKLFVSELRASPASEPEYSCREYFCRIVLWTVGLRQRLWLNHHHQSICIHILICFCICILIYVSVCICICPFRRIVLWAVVFCQYENQHICIFMCICMCILICICICVCICICIFSRITLQTSNYMCDSIIINTESQHYSFEGTLLKLVFELSQLRTDCVGVCLSNQKSQNFFSFFESFSLSEEVNTVATGWLSWVLSTDTLSIFLVRFSISKC